MVTNFLEPKAIPAGKAANPSAYARYSKLPLFAIFELKKP